MQTTRIKTNGTVTARYLVKIPRMRTWARQLQAAFRVLLVFQPGGIKRGLGHTGNIVDGREREIHADKFHILTESAVRNTVRRSCFLTH